MSQPNDRKQVLIRFTADQVERIQAHQERLSTSLGGSKTPFQTAVLHIIEVGLGEVEGLETK